MTQGFRRAGKDLGRGVLKELGWGQVTLIADAAFLPPARGCGGLWGVTAQAWGVSAQRWGVTAPPPFGRRAQRPLPVPGRASGVYVTPRRLSSLRPFTAEASASPWFQGPSRLSAGLAPDGLSPSDNAPCSRESGALSLPTRLSVIARAVDDHT